MATLRTPQARGDFFSEHPELRTPETVEALTLEATQLFRRDLHAAERLVEVSSWLADSIDDDFAKAKASRAAANLAHLQGDHSAALGLYDHAGALFRRLGIELEAAITSSSSLQALTYLGEHDRAMTEATQARSSFEKHGDRLRLARLNFNYANLLHRRDQWAEAASHYETAYQSFLEVGGSNEDLALCLGNMAVCHQNQQEFPQALEFYERTRAFCTENGLHGLVAGIDYNVAYLHFLRGQYTRALELYRETRQLHRDLGDRHHVDLCAMDESEIYLELNLTSESAELAQSALDGFRARGLVSEAARALTTLAISECRRGKHFLALELLAQARDQFHSEGNAVWTALIDLYRSGVFYRAGRPFEAKSMAEKSLESFDKLELAT